MLLLNNSIITPKKLILVGVTQKKQQRKKIFKTILGRFRKYDYGLIKNFVKYGSFTPPDYNLQNIVTPVALYYSRNDDLTAVVVSNSKTYDFCAFFKSIFIILGR